MSILIWATSKRSQIDKLLNLFELLDSRTVQKTLIIFVLLATLLLFAISEFKPIIR